MSIRFNWDRPPTYAQWQQDMVRSAALRELAVRRRARNSLIDFIHLCSHDYIEGIFTRRLINAVMAFVRDCEAGLSPHLMIFAPPRHGKSQIISRALPVWYLGRNPRHEIIAASSGQDIADEFGLYVRNMMNEPIFADLFPECHIDPSSNAVSKVTTMERGGYRAVGVGAQIVGRGGNLIIIDDPVKGRKEAYSAVERKNLYDWYRSNLYTRRAPGAGVLLMHQRWHPEDLAGTLIDKMKETSEGHEWSVINLPAIAEEDDEWRVKGEALFPERWPLKELTPIRSTMEPSEWLALYQQRPVMEEGGWFKQEFFQFYDQLPEDLYWYIFADYAVSVSSHADDSAIFPVGIDSNRNLYVAPDLFLGKLEPLDAVNKTLDFVQKYKAKYVAADDGVIEAALKAIFRERCRERNQFVSFHGVKRTVKKHIVAASYHARMQQCKVYWPDNSTVRMTVIPQHLNFLPDADNKHDDSIDGMANGCTMLDTMASPAPPVELPPVDEEAEDEAMWGKILGRAARLNSPKASFSKMNGEPYALRKE